MPTSNDTSMDRRHWPVLDADQADEIQHRLRELVRGTAVTDEERRALLTAAKAAEDLRIALIGVVNHLTAGRIEELERGRGQPAEVAIDGGGLLHRRDRGDRR